MTRSDSHVRVIAVCGGIGSGKSVVCRILESMGFEVYYCDERAKRLMDESGEIKRRIAEEVCEDAVADDVIDRKTLSEKVFSDSAALDRLNAIVHESVRTDVKRWLCTPGLRTPAFIETAILYQSGIDRMVSEVWEVTAPEDVRIRRVMNRNSLTAEQVRMRIEAQDSFVPGCVHDSVFTIINDEVEPVLPQVEYLLSRF